MDILFTKELHVRHHEAGISTAAFQPGTVRTSFYSEFGGSWSFVYTSFIKHFLRSPAKGAETMVWLATTKPDQDWKSGEFYKDKKISKGTNQARDETLAHELWELSSRVVGLTRGEM